ncbi:hypothetical protein OG418_48565 [Streptomyces phaeochromogenes]|uniref:hypothetical protein n=1 Tax=Streptomyces phaeochromogenes TaxID=1923 RepID=UPI00324F0D48
MALPLTDALLGCLPVVLPDRRYWFSWLQPGATVPGQTLFEDPDDPHIKEFRTVAPDPEQALPLIEKAYGDPGAAADTLGHIGLTQQVEQVAIALAATGERTTQEAVRLTNAVADTLDARNVLPSVVSSVRAASDSLPSS